MLRASQAPRSTSERPPSAALAWPVSPTRVIEPLLARPCLCGSTQAAGRFRDWSTGAMPSTGFVCHERLSTITFLACLCSLPCGARPAHIQQDRLGPVGKHDHMGSRVVLLG